MTQMALMWRTRHVGDPCIPVLGVLLGNRWEGFDVGVALMFWNGVVGQA